MSAIELTADPYRPPHCLAAAPTEAEPEVCLQPGEFQVRDGLLYVTGDTQLPQICLHTGDRADLVSEEIVVRFHPPEVQLVVGSVYLITVLVFSPLLSCTLLLATFAGQAAGLEFLPSAIIFALLVRFLYACDEWTSVPIRLRTFVARVWRRRRKTRRSRWWWGIVIGLVVIQIVSWLSWRSLIPLSLLILVIGCRCFRRIYRCRRQANGRQSAVIESQNGAAAVESFPIYCVRGFPVEFLGKQTRWK